MIKEVQNGLIINIKIIPNSSKNDIIIEDEFVKVKVTAQPIENKANKALKEFVISKAILLVDQFLLKKESYLLLIYHEFYFIISDHGAILLEE